MYLIKNTHFQLLELAVTPMVIVVGIGYFLVVKQLGFEQLADWGVLLSIAYGSSALLKDTLVALWQKRFALDYIALAAIATGLVTGEFLVAAVICLMLAGGTALEEYARHKAAISLRALANRIPDKVQLWNGKTITETVSLKVVTAGQSIAIRKGEVIALDGVLVSQAAEIDESSLTGEPYPVTKETGDQLTSGTVNAGDQLILQVTKVAADSTYRKIVALVDEARRSKSPLIRLADRYSTLFTVVTFGLAAITYFITGNPERVLAILVLATPCPLILATPIALIGGMNSAARRGIIIKNLASLEVLAKAKALVFDKTGTLTLGELKVLAITSHSHKHTEKEILGLAAAIERSSLHPVAKAIVKAAKAQHVTSLKVSNVKEVIGEGISATVHDQHYTLRSQVTKQGILVKIVSARKVLGSIELEDEIKPDSAGVLNELRSLSLQLFLLSGDTQHRVAQLITALKVKLEYQADCHPEDKTAFIKALQKRGLVTAMVGDGINDAPALATADTGIVFSHEEQSASSNAADIVLLGRQLDLVKHVIVVSRQTISIALQSIWVGLGLSIVGMVLASFGWIPPIAGAVTQEVIDVFVILNALRASRIMR